ncbi:MAG TPA: hypothetical protein VGM56_07075 [Byssovorax sp.]|jgi:hypothetical protein
MSMRSGLRPALVVVGAVAVCVGCVPPGAGGVVGGASVGAPGQPSAATLATLTRIMQQNSTNCDGAIGRATAKFNETMTTLNAKTDMAGKPLASPGTLVAQLKAQKVDVHIDLASVQMPMPIFKDSFMAEGQKAAAGGQPALQAFAKRSMVVQPLLTPLRTDVSAAGGALMSTIDGMQNCRLWADAYAHQFVAIKRGGGEVTPEMMQILVHLSTNSKKNDGIFASSVAIIATMQAGFAGKNPKAIDAVIAEVQKNDPTKAESSQAEVEAKMAEIEKELPSTAGAEIRGAPKPGGGGSDCASGGGPLPAVPTVPGVNMPGVQQAGAMACEAVQGLTALKNGDVGGALKSASKLAPPPLGPSLGAISSFFG